MPGFDSPRSARRLRARLATGLVTLLAAVWLYFHLARPASAFLAYNTDPELAYFLDSLAPFKGLPYRGMDHPGTPLTVAGTLLLALLVPFVGETGARFVTEMIRRPEPFFVLVHAVMAAGYVACIVALARGAMGVRRRRDAVLAVAVPASFFAFLPRSFLWPLYWSHNSIAFPAGTAVLLAVLAAARRGRQFPAAAVAALGLAVGLMSATQAFFGIWMLAVIAVAMAVERFGRARQWFLRPFAAGSLSAALGFALGTLPAASGLPRFFSFVRRMASHQGLYGGGQSGFTSLGVWTANVSSMVLMAPWLFVATAGTLALLAALFAIRRPRGRREAGLWAVAAAVAAQWLAAFAAFGKHLTPYYLPVLAAMLPILLAAAFTLARRRGPRARLACGVVAGAVLTGCAASAVLSVRSHVRRAAFRVAMDEEVERYRRWIADDRARGGGRSPLLLWGPTLPDARCYALWGVNTFLADGFRSEISALCPSDGLAWSNSVAVPDGWSATGPVSALLVIPDDVPVRFPAFAALGQPEAYGSARDPDGRRLAFYRIELRDGRAHRAPR